MGEEGELGEDDRKGRSSSRWQPANEGAASESHDCWEGGEGWVSLLAMGGGRKSMRWSVRGKALRAAMAAWLTAASCREGNIKD